MSTAAPLVFVPALGSDERLWQPVADLVSATTETLVVRGEGSSMEEMADSVLAQAPDSFYLAGNSMGGYVSLEIALRGTPAVLGLALLNSSAVAADDARRQNSLGLIDMVRGGGFDEAVTLISTAVGRGRSDVSALAAEMARDLGPDVFIAQQTAVMTRRDRRAELPFLTVPTLVLAGTEDAITPQAWGGEIAAAVPGAELTVLDGIGHLSTVEAPSAVAVRLGRWLDSLRTSARSAGARS
ncbi:MULTISPECIES: alpha/beta fold hydrolase [unclassified Rhodococcus (in: high G+C Gram-positive bacteria)]|uniref:alpha/beta fold hydrolase n=1 Tax=unclassified Rhodococcus (in: high G+C Gram-positive bacteria) TaxID=192944 RepID=UPI0027E19C78|nr:MULTISPECIES: alpha/beta fold hydrolase [unclassified Rhodococcus (in: high G+C Gram-positive bacteria)]